MKCNFKIRIGVCIVIYPKFEENFKNSCFEHIFLIRRGIYTTIITNSYGSIVSFIIKDALVSTKIIAKVCLIWRIGIANNWFLQILSKI
ncbi:hypothetical protein Avbf_10341 [Armadillidium vulgare]|nr:hypothetical protein Avbf_10341 [Armadillidium vulgare]